MTRTFQLKFTLALLACVTPAHAYVGPGTGLSTIGSVLTFVIVSLLVIAALLWYPLKKLLNWYKKTAAAKRGNQDGSEESPPG